MPKITRLEKRYHTKASEEYVDVIFVYEPPAEYSTSVPVKYRRTGTDIDENEIDGYLSRVHDEVDPVKWDAWKREQDEFWRNKPNASVTKAFFDVLANKFNWCCVSCELPQNPNWARRIQDIKEFGYTLATHTNRFCQKCGKNTTQLILIPIKRGGITGYETWSETLRNRIIQLLNSYDAYEAKVMRKEGLLPDHKFPEIRWDSTTRRDSLEDLSDHEIRRDFQLLSNQRNQQKREVCRICFQTGQRAVIYGIPFFYKGSAIWDASIPKTGKDAEPGCEGCGWYDITKWRKEMVQRLNGINP